MQNNIRILHMGSAALTAADNNLSGELTVGSGEPGVGEVQFESQFDDYGSGAFPIEHLARPMLAECPQGESQ